jgi:hypothetical protein
VIAMDYYGVTMHIGNLGGNFYLNQFILAVVEFPAKISTMVLLNRIGRRKLHVLIMMIGGAALLCTIFPVLYGKEGKFKASLSHSYKFKASLTQ